ncbi:hypothetical protein [Pseudoduganella umbonata]|uniref:Uncharacterized protein n=1 Tax=Pseudoduganella umbonata TaxID=864828 RepID=A0A7W5E8S3_9BURK|nr:hypothetical protein [Pseudoduganella umbonata]MBB3220096.1 hypothetical protein [Pseudoduganella umbonata]
MSFLQSCGRKSLLARLKNAIVPALHSIGAAAPSDAAYEIT